MATNAPAMGTSPTIVLPTPRPRVAPIQPINPEPRQCDASELVIESTEPANIKVIGADKLSQFLATQNSRLFIVNTEVTPDMQLFLTVKRDPGLVMAIHTEQGDLPIAKATQNEECKAGERTHVRINSETRRLDILSGSGVSIDSIDESN